MFTIAHLPNDKNVYIWKQIVIIYNISYYSGIITIEKRVFYFHLLQVYRTHTAKLVFEIIDLAIIVCFLNIVRNIDINVRSL